MVEHTGGQYTGDGGMEKGEGTGKEGGTRRAPGKGPCPPLYLGRAEASDRYLS